METVHIQTESKRYPVIVGEGAIAKLPNFLRESFPDATKVLIITDHNVGNRYLATLKDVLREFSPLHYVVPNGEHAKTFDVYYDCLTFALENKLDRKSIVLAFGGGAVGDLTGFVAATFMRGVPFIQIPTTILAHDSAVGGKVAINHPIGKNMIGAFYQPEGVFYDLTFLRSLPNEELRSGFAEVIKHGLIRDESFYHWLQTNIDHLDNLPNDQLSHCLVRGIEIKGEIVAKDEKEHGIRSFLNFGHTLGHAIEGEAGYGKMTHGEAVMIGMIFALTLSNKYTNLNFPIEPFKSWVSKLGYETNIPFNLSIEGLLERMKQDKKSIGGQIQFVLLEKIGHPIVYKLSDQEIMEALEHFK